MNYNTISDIFKSKHPFYHQNKKVDHFYVWQIMFAFLTFDYDKKKMNEKWHFQWIFLCSLILFVFYIFNFHWKKFLFFEDVFDQNEKKKQKSILMIVSIWIEFGDKNFYIFSTIEYFILNSILIIIIKMNDDNCWK